MTIELTIRRNGFALSIAKDEISLTVTKYLRRADKIRVYTIKPSAIAKAIVRKALAII